MIGEIYLRCRLITLSKSFITTLSERSEVVHGIILIKYKSTDKIKLRELTLIHDTHNDIQFFRDSGVSIVTESKLNQKYGEKSFCSSWQKRESLTVYSSVVTICTTCFSTLQQFILPTECMCVSYGSHSKQWLLPNLCSRDVMLPVWYEFIFTYYLEEIHSLKG
jgi:hypothetical protein